MKTLPIELAMNLTVLHQQDVNNLSKNELIINNSSSSIDLFCNKQNLFFDWKKAFENLSVDEKVNHLNETLLKLF